MTTNTIGCAAIERAAVERTGLAKVARRALAGMLVAWPLAAAPAFAGDMAQPEAPVQGTRVRISAPGITEAAVVGTVRTLDEGTITIDVAGRGEQLTVPRERISRLEVSAGRRSRLVGALIGTLVGGGVGALIGKASYSPRPYSFESASEAGGAIFGALLGAGVGALVPPGERWNEIPVSRYRVSFAPRLDRTAGVSFALRF